MAASYTGVFVFGDSLVDSGNALELAETYNYFPFTTLPSGAPTNPKGYYKGRFTDGYTFADLISSKFIGTPTKAVFPFGYDDPYLGISLGFFSDPSGDNLNFAYGGAQIRQGSEAVPDLDDQTDAFRDAVDGDALAAEAFRLGTAAQDADDRIIFDTASGTLYFDPDGTGGLAAKPFATLLGTSVHVSAAVFLVV